MYISNGNIKVKCSIWSLPCQDTCKPGVKCKAWCYANKAEVQYKQVAPCRLANLVESMSDTFIQDMVGQLSKKKSKYVRIHESGDFYSEKYILAWYEIAYIMPDKTFYAYTKRDDLFTKELLASKPDNMIIIYSIDGIDPDVNNYMDKINLGFDKIAMISTKQTNCPAQKYKNIKCIEHCKRCATKKNEVIIFSKH